LQANEIEEEDVDKEFLGNADLSLTQRYLQKKQKIKEQQQAKTTKEVDRKASKNRKIRYVVHEKIVNFMTIQENIDKMDGRDAIVGNLFGVQKHQLKKVTVADGGVRLI